MSNELQGRKIAILATDGVEQVELTGPREALEGAGATTELISLQDGEIQAFDHIDHADRFTVDRKVADADPSDYDGLLIPGGVANGDFLRADEDAVRFTAAFAEAHKPIASICHGPWVLVEAGIVKGRTITSFPSLATDVRNAGGTWVDEEVHVDNGLVTSRKPDDIPAFSAKAIEEFAEGAHEDMPQPA
jgi:protease I